MTLGTRHSWVLLTGGGPRDGSEELCADLPHEIRTLASPAQGPTAKEQATGYVIQHRYTYECYDFQKELYIYVYRGPIR